MTAATDLALIDQGSCDGCVNDGWSEFDRADALNEPPPRPEGDDR